MDNAELLDKLTNIKQRREMEIYLEFNEKDKNILEKHFVADVQYLGNINVAGLEQGNDENAVSQTNTEIQNEQMAKEKAVFKVIEQSVDEDGYICFIDKYYTEDFMLLGIHNPKFNIAFMPLLKFSNDEELKDTIIEQIEELPEQGINLKDLEKNQLKEIAKALGMDEDEINAMSEMDLAQSIEEKKEAQQDKDDNKEQQIGKKEVKQLTDQKQEIDLNTRVDYKRTLGEVLDLDTSEFSKVAIVYSDRLNEVTNSNENRINTRYSFVAIKKDGTAVNINDRLKVDERSGNAQNREALKVGEDERVRKDTNTKTRFQIIGKNGKNANKPIYERETLSVEMGAYGTVEPYFGKYTRDLDVFETRIRTTNRRPSSTELLKLGKEGSQGIDKRTNMAREAKSYLNDDRIKNKGDGSISMQNADGDEYSVEEGIEVFVEKHMEEWFKVMWDNEKISDKFTEKEVKDRIKELWIRKYAPEAKEIDEKISKADVDAINEKIEDDIMEEAEYVKVRGVHG